MIKTLSRGGELAKSVVNGCLLSRPMSHTTVGAAGGGACGKFDRNSTLSVWIIPLEREP